MARRHADPHRRRSERGQTDARRSSSSRLRYSEASRSGRRRRSSRQQGFLRTFESEHLAVAARRHSQPQHLDARRQTLARSDDQHPRYRFDRFGWRGIGAHRRRGRRPGNGQPSGHRQRLGAQRCLVGCDLRSTRRIRSDSGNDQIGRRGRNESHLQRQFFASRAHGQATAGNRRLRMDDRLYKRVERLLQRTESAAILHQQHRPLFR